MAAKQPETVNVKFFDERTIEQCSSGETGRVNVLKNRKKLAKGRLTKAKKKLNELIAKAQSHGNVHDKSVERAEMKDAIEKVRAEFSIVKKLIENLKEVYGTGEDGENDIDVDTIIESLENEFSEISSQVNECIKEAKSHLKNSKSKGSVSTVSLESSAKTRSSISCPSSKLSLVEQRRMETTEASKRLELFVKEQQQQEWALTLAKLRTEEARKVVSLNEAREKAAESEIAKDLSPKIKTEFESNKNLPSRRLFPVFPQVQPVKLKGVALPVFSGEDKTDYEPWKAAFMSVVDESNISVKEKMLRLQSSLTGKALKMVKDFGFSENAYERAKDKLEKKFGGERRLQLKHLASLRSWPKLRPQNLEDLEGFVSVLDRVLIAIQDSGSGGELRDQNLSLTAKEKLPEEDIQAYKFWLVQNSEEDTFESLIQWLEIKIQIMDEAQEETGQIFRRKNPKPSDKQDEKRRHARGYSTSSKPKKCVVESCGQNHPPWTCEKFKKLSVFERKEVIARSGRCFRCLAAGHQSKTCPNARRCGVNGCQSNNHSRYLHNSSFQQRQTSQLNPGEINSSSNIEPTSTIVHGKDEYPPANLTGQSRSHSTHQAVHVSLMVLPAYIANENVKLKVNVMLDPCSTGSYVTENAAEELRLQGHSQTLTISGTGGTETVKQSKRVTLSVCSLEGGFSAQLQANVLDDIASDTPAFEWSELKTKWPHLQPIPFDIVSRRKQIDVLIGSDHPIFHQVSKEIIGSQSSDPIACLTNLGWVCFGPALVEEVEKPNSRSHATRTYRSSSSVAETELLNETLRKFWDIESIGIRDTNDTVLTLNDKAVIDRAKETLVFKEGRYELGIPWKKGEPNFEDNYEMVFARLQRQEKSLLKRGAEISKAYDQIINDYVNKGYVRKIQKAKENQWFLPHFPVVRQDKTTTKVRIVFDAAAKHDGKSLNDAIFSGPKLQRELTDVLTRFRRAPVALSADISEMFLQVSMRETDKPFHRFLWRSFDSSRDPDIYEFQRLLFGNTASPFCAQYVLQTHATTYSAKYPKAAETVASSMYVDDVLDSEETVEDAKLLRRQLSELLDNAGFKLRKWSSNEIKVIEDVPPKDRLSSVAFINDSTPTVKALGVLWNPNEDVFSFKVEPSGQNVKQTKRNVLRTIATLFDPLQFLSPFTVRAKILMQEIWTAGIEWDEELPDPLKKKWQKWLSEIPQLSGFTIPRCLRNPNPTCIQLHTFSDASKDAYAAAAYLVCRYPSSKPTSRLIASKSRVAPLKAITIPRLELMGAVLSTRLSLSILKTLSIDQAFYWTDSSNVWYWIRSHSRSFKPFIANRVGEIQEHTEPEQWRHVPGELNPADLPTRGIQATDLTESKQWSEGPDFLRADESTWPGKPHCDNGSQTSEIESVTHATEIHEEKKQLCPFTDPNRFSSFHRLICVTGWIRRFLHNCQLPKDSRETSSVLRPSEIAKAQNYWFRYAQADAFGEKDRDVLKLNAQKDEHGILRSNGRLRYAEDLPYDVRHPIILPKSHAVTRLVITDAHQKLGHGTGVEHLLTELRTKFWVVKGRRNVRNIIESCSECRRRFHAKPACQMMAPLPKSRIKQPLKAFERVGIDYAGPFLTKQGRGKQRAKRYLCLFTCLVTRAVHLELAYGLDTDSFINAFTRMTSRRGTPSYVVSDNGTNFVGAERELRELVEALDQDEILQKTCRYHQIDWKFNPPSAPHFGGVFDARIKSAKRALRAILRDADVTDEELQTAMCGAESLLNSRPITYVSSDPNDLIPLTPNHFIVGQLGGQFAPEASELEQVFNPRKRWHRIQQLIGDFWRRWRRELLPTLNVRKKWFKPHRNFEQGDVVVLAEPKANRREWILGRITQTYPGADGLVRVAKVRVGDAEYLRPIHRLCPLEYSDGQ